MFEEYLISPEDSGIWEFGEDIASVHAALTERQKSLGKEFEVIWDANIEQLYES